MRAGSSAHQAELSVERQLNVNRRAVLHVAMESFENDVSKESDDPRSHTNSLALFAHCFCKA
jgi:hypothetical protein